MGNSESSNPIRNLDKRTARREYREDFIRAITRYRQLHPPPPQSLTKASAGAGAGGMVANWEDNSIKVFVRKRPIFSHEISHDEYDVITCYPSPANPPHIVIHDCRMHTDMKRQFINHHEFQFDEIFDEKAENTLVYEKTAKPLINIACEGGFSTALVYGQTGSGKTFTMSYIYSKAAHDIFSYLHSHIDRFDDQPLISLSFIEIAGDHVSDLLNAFHPTELKSSSDGTVHPFPVTEPTVTSAEELLAVIQHGLNIRTTAATGVHDASSRSHAILKIYIQRSDKNRNTAVGGGGGGGNNNGKDVTEGTLTLVDLAGSEHRIDSMYHGKERRKETSYINASLMALKECIRARATGTPSNLYQHVYRKSKLTMALKNSFHLPYAKTIVIATVSPASKDTEHSLNTLRHACIMQGGGGGGNGESEETRFVTGGKTTMEQIGEVNIAKLARKNFEKKKTNHGELDSLKTDNGNALESKLARAANKEVEITEKMKKKMRRLSENKSWNELGEGIRHIISQARQRIRNEPRQLARFQFLTFPTNFQGDDLMNNAGNNDIIDEEDEIDDEEEGGEGKIDDDVDTFYSSLPKPEEDGYSNNKKESASSSSQISGKPSRSSSNDHHQQRQSKGIPIKGIEKNVATYEDDFETITPRNPPTITSSNNNNKQYIRVPYQKIYDAIFLAQDSVPLPILLMQLRAILKIHDYSPKEIEELLSKEGNGGGGSSSSNGKKEPFINKSEPQLPIKQDYQDELQLRPSPITSTPKRIPRNSMTNQISAPPVQNTPRANKRDSTPTNINAAPVPTRRAATPTNRRPLSASRRQPDQQQQMSDDSSWNNESVGNSSTRRQSSSSGGGGSSALAIQSSNRQSVTAGQLPSATSSAKVDKEKEEKAYAAKLQIEQEAIQKKARQDAARQYREEMEKQKTSQILAKHEKLGVNNTKAKRITKVLAQALTEEEERIQQLQQEIDFHNIELTRLNAILEKDIMTKDYEEKLSMAQKFGVKKQISLHRAAVLKAERKMKEPNDSSAITQQQHQQGGASAATLSKDLLQSNGGIETPRSSSASRERLSQQEGITRQDSFPNSRQQRLSQQQPQQLQQQRQPQESSSSVNNQRYYGARNVYPDVPSKGDSRKPEWNYDIGGLNDFSDPNTDLDYNNNLNHPDSGGVGAGGDDALLFSDMGRPLSIRMAQNIQKRSSSYK